MKKFNLTEREIHIINNGLLVLIENTNEAAKLVRNKNTVKAIEKEREEYLSLLNKLCEVETCK